MSSRCSGLVSIGGGGRHVYGRRLVFDRHRICVQLGESVTTGGRVVDMVGCELVNA